MKPENLFLLALGVHLVIVGVLCIWYDSLIEKTPSMGFVKK